MILRRLRAGQRAVVFLGLVTTLLSLLVGVRLSPAFAEQSECAGMLPPGTYEDLIVPSGATCELRDVVVQGNVRVLSGGTLFVETSEIAGNVVGHDVNRIFVGRSTVGGNIIVIGGEVVGAPGATVAICATVVNGNVVIQRLTGGIGVRAFIPGFDPPSGLSARCGSTPNTIGGNLNVSNNASVRMLVQGNVVENNLLAVHNTGPGAKIVTRNQVANAVICIENEPPFIGEGNTARHAKGQCSSP